MDTCNENRNQFRSYFIQQSKYDYNEIGLVFRQNAYVKQQRNLRSQVHGEDTTKTGITTSLMRSYNQAIS